MKIVVMRKLKKVFFQKKKKYQSLKIKKLMKIRKKINYNLEYQNGYIQEYLMALERKLNLKNIKAIMPIVQK